MKKQTMDYGTWLRAVDKFCWQLSGCSIHDLPDCCFADWHEQGMSPGTAARKAIKTAKE